MPYLENDSTNVHFKAKDVLEHDSPPLPIVSATLKQRVVTCQNMAIAKIDEVARMIGLAQTENWRTFRKHPLLTDEVRVQFLIDAINNALEELLYKRSATMPYYLSLVCQKQSLPQPH